MVKKIWERATYDEKDAYAFQAFVMYAHGLRAQAPGPEDCKLVLDTIIHKICLMGTNGFVPDDPNGRIAAFMDGRQFVGREIDLLSKIKPELLNVK
jgi:hypothetical protein